MVYSVYCLLPDKNFNWSLMNPLPLMLMLAAAVSADDHLSGNPVYSLLRDGNLNGSPEEALRMPAPAMPDGLTAAQQMAVIKKLAGTTNLTSFTRKSVTANPLKIRVEKISGTDAPYRRCHYYYIAYGDLSAMASQDFFKGQLAGARDTKVTNLTLDALKKRGINELNTQHEGYGYAVTDVIKKVELSTLGRGYWSKTDESIVFASLVDPRFTGDKEYPNQWQEKKRNSRGVAELGPAQPYSGSGVYTKVTRLKQPAGALFIETQMYYSEPKGWFNGVNLLGAKLPATVKLSIVREMRRDITAATEKLQTGGSR